MKEAHLAGMKASWMAAPMALQTADWRKFQMVAQMAARKAEMTVLLKAVYWVAQTVERLAQKLAVLKAGRKALKKAVQSEQLTAACSVLHWAASWESPLVAHWVAMKELSLAGSKVWQLAGPMALQKAG